LSVTFLFAQPAHAIDASWLQNLEQDAIADGVSPDTVHAALNDFTPNEHVVELDQKQPEKAESFAAYRHNIVSESRIHAGAELYRQNYIFLKTLEAQTGVPAAIIVALWGIESSFGRNPGITKR